MKSNDLNKFNFFVSYVSSVSDETWSHVQTCKKSWTQKHLQHESWVSPQKDMTMMNSPEDESLENKHSR